MPETSRIPWSRILVEGVAILVSILLAFGIQAWWDHSQERGDEIESLRLVSQDLMATIAQMEEFDRGLASRAAAAEAAVSTLTGPFKEIDRNKTVENILIAGLRRTIALPSSAYTDLLSTGRLRIIRDRSLRGAIIEFYQNMERSEIIIESNSKLYSDELITKLFYGEGLLRSTGGRAIDNSVYRDDPLWDLPENSTQWNKAVSAIIAKQGSINTQQINSTRIIESAKMFVDLINGRLY